MLFHSHISEGEFLQLQPERLPLNSCGFQAWRWLASTGDFTESPAETNKGAGQRNVWFHRTTAERMWWETSTELSTEFSLIGVTLCSRLKHVHSHCWRVSSIFSVILMTHVSVFRLSRVEPECLPCLTYGGLFPERVGPVCLSVCLWLGGRASQETAHKHTDTHRVFVSCLNKGGRWGFVAAGGSVVPSVSSPCRIPVSVIESRSETTTSNRPHNNTLIEISPETILRVVSRRNRIAVCVCSGKHFHSGSPLEELSVTHTFKLDPRLSHRPSGSFSFPSLTSVLQCPLLQTWPQDPKKASLLLSLVLHGMHFSTKHTKSENLLN